MRRQPVKVRIVFLLPAVDRIYVHRRTTRPFGHHGHIGVAGGHGGKKLVFELGQHRAHVAHGAVA